MDIAARKQKCVVNIGEFTETNGLGHGKKRLFPKIELEFTTDSFEGFLLVYYGRIWE